MKNLTNQITFVLLVLYQRLKMIFFTQISKVGIQSYWKIMFFIIFDGSKSQVKVKWKWKWNESEMKVKWKWNNFFTHFLSLFGTKNSVIRIWKNSKFLNLNFKRIVRSWTMIWFANYFKTVLKSIISERMDITISSNFVYEWTISSNIIETILEENRLNKIKEIETNLTFELNFNLYVISFKLLENFIILF